MKKNHIYQGNNIDVLKTFPDESVDCVVTSPPYWGLRDYGTAEWEGGDDGCSHIEQKCLASDKNTLNTGKKGKQYTTISMQYKSECKKCGAIRKDRQLGLEETPEEFVDNLVKVFSEVKRVLKSTGTCWLNLGDSYMSSSYGMIESNDPKNNKTINMNKREDKSCNYCKKTYKGTKNQRFCSKQCAGVDNTPRDKKNILKAKNLVGIPWKVAFALQADGWYLRQDIIWHKPNPMPESVQDRCTKSHEYIFLLTKSSKYFYDIDAIREPLAESSIGRLKQNIDKQVGTTRANGGAKSNGNFKATGSIEKGANKRSVWTITTKPYKEAHFATFPIELPTYCIKAGCPEGGIVLDPFMGSGTTGLAARNQQRNYVGIDLNPEYIEIAERRLQQLNLFI